MDAQETSIRDSGLSHSQLQIWLGQRRAPASPLYNMTFAFLLEGELDAAAFDRAWQSVVDRSDALRTRLTERGGRPRRGRHPLGACANGHEDFSRCGDAEERFFSWCRQRCAVPLPLAGELVDSVLVRLGDGRTGWYLNQHHLVTDAWSTQLLVAQVAQAYEAQRGAAAASGEQGQVPAGGSYYETVELPTQSTVQGSAITKARAHWQHRTPDEAGGSRLVRFYGQELVQVGSRSRRHTMELTRAETSRLHALAGEEGWRSFSPEISRFTLLATLFTSWLHRVSGQWELGFDAPVSGRSSARAKQTLGLFIEMFPFAVDISPGDTFRSLGSRCLAEAQTFLRHSLPGLSRPSQASASNAVLNYVPQPFSSFGDLPLRVHWLHPGHGDSVHAVRLQAHDFSGSGRLTLHLDCNEDALPSPFQERAAAHLRKLVEACLADPDQVIGRAPMLLADEHSALLRLDCTQPETVAAAPGEGTVVEQFLRQAERTPHAAALRERGQETSFRELRRQVEHVAALLTADLAAPRARASRDAGSGGVEGKIIEARVAILARRSRGTVAAVLGTLRAGAAYVPLDPGHPTARLRHQLLDSGAQVLLHDGAEHLAPELLEGLPQVRVRSLDPRAPRIEADAPDDLPSLPQAQQLAYLLYTSGSTGEPKGVLVEHLGLVDYLSWAESTYVRGERLTYALFTPLSFDLTVTSLFLPLITGGTLEVYPESDGPLDAAVVDVVRHNVVDFLKLTPSHLAILRQLDLRGSRLRRLVVGGEDLPASLAGAVSAQLDDRVEIYNEYGPTEAVVGCTVHRFRPGRDERGSVPIGRPADGVSAQVLNQEHLAVPLGVPGELWVARRGLASGYHQRAELTAERFVERPTAKGAPAVHYRTGDRVRLDAEENLVYLGRLDRQVKVSGVRIEPAEIEAAALAHQQVQQCVVLAQARSPARAPAISAQERSFCARCGLPSDYPGARFDEHEVCNVCRAYESIEQRAQAYFKSIDDLQRLFAEERAKGRASGAGFSGEFDCMLLLSGGKDSTYALCRLVDLGLRVRAFTLDNGFISEGAKENMRRVTEQLGVPLEFATTPAMNAIFRDSLRRFSNVCQGCFKTIYTLGMQRARELHIPILVTGLSRGQMFETRLTEELFRDGRFSPEEVDAAVLAARKVYHRVDDQVSRSLDVAAFREDAIFEEVQIVDFYRYCDVGLEQVLSYLAQRVPWVRPSDTGRSTNCLINDIGIWVHQRERSFHNYALPYSWDVRLGHKTREQALAELHDEIDEEHVQRTLFAIGYRDEVRPADEQRHGLVAYYVARGEVSAEELRSFLGIRLPASWVPGELRQLAALPLTANGKVDTQALQRLSPRADEEAASWVAPRGPVEEALAGFWRQELGLDRVGAQSNFFSLGGTSLGAMQVMIRLCREFDIELPLESLFEHPTVRELAALAEEKILADVEEMSDSEQEALLASAEETH